jgi:hypothetical protein
MFLIAFSSTIALAVLLSLSTRRLFDSHHRVLRDRISRRSGPKPSDALLAFLKATARLAKSLTHLAGWAPLGTTKVAGGQTEDVEEGQALAAQDAAAVSKGRARGVFAAVTPAGSAGWLDRLGLGRGTARGHRGNDEGAKAEGRQAWDGQSRAGKAGAWALSAENLRVGDARTGEAWLSAAPLLLPAGGSAALVGPSG